MESPTLTNINRSQEGYLNLLLLYKECVQADDLSVTDICAMLDEVKCFWLKQLRLIEFELEELAEIKTCFVLTGAIYLDISGHEHYFFKTLGECHIVSDPFSKLDMIFRHPEEDINVVYMLEYFKKAFNNTLEILTTYNGKILVLPIQEIAVEDVQKHRELLDLFYWRFISDAFDNEFKSNEDFHKKYQCFEEIEAGLNSYVRENIIFSNLSDRNLSLRERVEEHYISYKKISSANLDISDVDMFLIAVFSSIAQISDILYVCSVLNMNPYIVSEITFSNLTLIMNVFVDDEYLREMLERTLVSYLFYRTIDVCKFDNITFIDYCKRLEEKALLSSILDKIHNQKIDVFLDKISNVIKIIEDEFEAVL